jgi:dihydrofolate reductase
MRIVVIDHVTLDGVMQSPAGPDEDTRGGFAHGGWATPYADQVLGEAMGARMAEAGGLLLGRRTYEHLLAHWNAHPHPVFTDRLNETPKHVASTTLEPPLPWPNSTLLPADVPGAVAALKQQPGGDLHVLGSGALVRSLMPHGLVDEYLLTIHPLVLGEGQRLFDDGVPPTAFELVDATPTTTGVILATYRALRARD